MAAGRASKICPARPNTASSSEIWTWSWEAFMTRNQLWISLHRMLHAFGWRLDFLCECSGLFLMYILVVYIIVAVTITSRQSYPHSCWWKECSTNQRIASIYKEYEPWNLSAFLHIPTIWGYKKPEDNHDGLWQSSFSRANQMEFLSCVRRKLLQNPRSGFMDWTWIPRCKSEKRQCDLAFACQC